MVFGTRYQLKHQARISFTIEGKELELVPHYKYLGTYVDSELNFTRQSNKTIKLVSYKLYFLTKIKKYLNTLLLIQLCKAYIQPFFNYNNIFLERYLDLEGGRTRLHDAPVLTIPFPNNET